jgi:NAD(P)-dependent dehydrogenase (short-subunit alcohol dehydrogenase family)
VLVAGAPGESLGGGLGAAVSDACAGLGAVVSHCLPDATEEAALDAAVARVVGETGRIDLLAVDGAGLFAHGLMGDGAGQTADGSPHTALRACMDCAWNVTRAVVNQAFLLPAGAGKQPAGVTGQRSGGGGRIVYLAPPSGGARCDDYAEAACAGLENLARTLSIEWARHGITAVAIAPGAGTAADEVAVLTAYLASPAGAYFSGCLLDLRGPTGDSRSV